MNGVVQSHTTEVETLHSSCKYVMLHDVVDRDCPGVRQQWAELIDDNATQVVARCFQQPSGLSGTQFLLPSLLSSVSAGKKVRFNFHSSVLLLSFHESQVR
eukprot:882146-Amphidinium_carterae.1